MNRSTKYNFYLPQNSDPISVSDFNFNFEVIDQNLLTKAQSLSDTQKKAITDNAGAVSTLAQTLSSTEKAQARTNIGAVSAEDIAGKLSYWETSVNESSSKNVSLENNGRYLIVLNSTATTAKCMAIVSVSSGGVVNVVKIGEASNISFTTGTRQLTVVNATTQNVLISVIVLA